MSDPKVFWEDDGGDEGLILEIMSFSPIPNDAVVPEWLVNRWGTFIYFLACSKMDEWIIKPVMHIQYLFIPIHLRVQSLSNLRLNLCLSPTWLQILCVCVRQPEVLQDRYICIFAREINWTDYIICIYMKYKPSIWPPSNKIKINAYQCVIFCILIEIHRVKLLEINEKDLLTRFISQVSVLQINYN